MEFSESFYLRKKKLENLEVPTITELKASQGEDLSVLILELCPESLKEDMSIDKKLAGPGEDLWISPSDLLIPKVVLKPPLTNKYMKALTHEGILEIGAVIEERFRHWMELNKEEALRDQEDVLTFMFEKEKARALNEALAAQHEVYREKMEELEDDFQRLLSEELDKLERHLREIYEQVLEEKIVAMLEEQETYWLDKIDDAVSEVVETLTKKFLKDLNAQEQQLTEMFKMKLEGQAERYQNMMQLNEDVYNTMLKQLKHNLQCNNIANLMYVMCLERRKSLLEHQQVIAWYDGIIKDLNGQAERQNQEIKRLTKERDLKDRHCTIRDECLANVICHFQKFINFALRSTPTQAEFLLNVREMMKFELETAEAAVKEHPVHQIMPWATYSQETVRHDPNENVLNDYHDCLNEMRKPLYLTDSEMSLHAFTYKKHLYVREDFRNKVSAGYPVRADSRIWNSDVEHLVQILKHIAEPSLQGSIVSSVDRRSHASRPSSVHFDRFDSASVDPTVGLLATQDSVILQKSHLSTIDELQEMPICESSRVPLLGAPDSLTIIKNVSLAGTGGRGVVDDQDDDLLFYDASKVIQICKSELHPTDNENRHSTITLQLSRMHSEGLTPAAAIALTASKKKVGNWKDNEKPAKRSHSKKMEAAGDKISKMSMHRDSLDLIRTSINYEPTHRKLKDLLVAVDVKENRFSQFIKIPQEGKPVDVDFSHVARTYCGGLCKPMEEVAKKKRDDVNERDNFLTKPGAAKIVSNCFDEKGEVVANSSHSSRVYSHNVHSYLDMLKKNDSLIRIFTGCTQ